MTRQLIDRQFDKAQIRFDDAINHGPKWPAMIALMATHSMFAYMFAGWEVVLIFAVVIILFGAGRLPGLGRGLGEGLLRFRKALGQVDEEMHDAGKSLGGIYGKPAAEALTTDNQTAELYDPAVLREKEGTGRTTKRMLFRGWRRFWRLVWHVLENLG